MKSSPLSVAVITHNEERNIADCLKSLSFANEVIVVDSGSTDQTVSIAKQLGAKVIDQPWLGYGLQKQKATQCATHDWVLSIDADERVSEELQQSIAKALEKPESYGYYIARKNRFMNRWLSHGEGYPDWVLRLFNKQHAKWSNDTVHEKILCDKPLELKGDLYHYSQETWRQYLDKQNRYTDLQAQAFFEKGQTVTYFRMLTSPLFRFIKMYLFKRGFLDGLPGLIHILIGCRNSFQKYAKLKKIYTKRPKTSSKL